MADVVKRQDDEAFASGPLYHNATGKVMSTMNMSTTIRWVGLILLFGSLPSARADIFLDAATKAICITDYPEGYPCTFERLLAIDRRQQWDKILYNPATDTYTVCADLRIGSHDGSDTFFQIGSSNHPRETVVMRGSIFIEPFWVPGQNREEQRSQGKRIINRLTLGEPANAAITPVLKFDCQKRGQYGIHVGSSKGYGGQFHVYYGVVTAAQPDREHAFYSSAAGGDSVVFDHASVSWTDQAMFYGMGNGLTQKARLADSTFAHGGAGLVNSLQMAERCTFEDFETAILDYGCLDATLTDCVLANNAANWALTYSEKGLICVDCRYDTPRKGNKLLSWENKTTGKRQYPKIVSKRHVIVAVADPDGKAITNATVMVSNDQQDREAVEPLKSRVNARGLTPGKGEPKAILMNEFLHQATDVENKPAVKEYSYRIAAEALGYEKGGIAAFKPVKSWETIMIVLQPIGEGKNEKQ